MVGETGTTGSDCVAKTIELAPDSVTIYQMELPYNTVVLEGTEGDRHTTSRRWRSPTGRPSGAWVEYAFDELAKAGYDDVAAPTPWCKDKAKTRVRLSRRALARGRHVRHRRRLVRPRQRRPHAERGHAGKRTSRSSTAASCRWAGRFPTTERERLIREMILQLKTGRLDVAYFRDKFGVDIRDEFRGRVRRSSQREGWLTVTGESVDCTRDGLMQIDRHLPAFFDPQYISIAVHLIAHRDRLSMPEIAARS